jgi:hypothetical protein
LVECALELVLPAKETMSTDYAAFLCTDLYGSFEAIHIAFSFQFFCLQWCKMCRNCLVECALELVLPAKETMSTDYAAFLCTDLYGSFEAIHIAFSFQFFYLQWCKMCRPNSSWFVLKKTHGAFTFVGLISLILMNLLMWHI